MFGRVVWAVDLNRTFVHRYQADPQLVWSTHTGVLKLGPLRVLRHVASQCPKYPRTVNTNNAWLAVHCELTRKRSLECRSTFRFASKLTIINACHLSRCCSG